MAATSKIFRGDLSAGELSPGPQGRGRENAKDTLCRNIAIYGHCRYQDKGCAFNHDSGTAQPMQQPESIKKRLNVDSPSFTPLSLPSNGVSKAAKSRTISPKAAAAEPFMPKGLSSVNRPGSANRPVHQEMVAPRWATPEIQEFIPQSFNALEMSDGNVTSPAPNPFDPYGTAAGNIADSSVASHQPQVNPYAQDTTGLGSMGTAYYQGQGNYAQPLQYHLYAPLGPHRENLLPFQRTVHDFFISDSLREELQRKAEASLQVLPNSTLPSQIDHFHSLVPLDITNQKNAAIFGYPSWIYKAVSSKDGKLYALRRLEGYRLTNEKAIRCVQLWKRLDNANVVTIHDAFTTGAFGDRSLIFVTDYHPLSKTLTEQYLSAAARLSGRPSGSHIVEQTLWNYIVQIASALKSIHSMGLAARLIDPSKILLTSKGRVRLNGCAVLDVVQFDIQVNMSELQQEDLVHFGRLILALGTLNPNAVHNIPKCIEFLSRSYTAKLKDCVLWLLSPTSQPQPLKTIDQFLQGISDQVVSTLNTALHHDDALSADLIRELENGRLVRLMAKLNFINERPEFDHDRQWSETGDRYFLKLFRDYVFHQVDANGNPVVDLGHVITCLNKLDAGIDERISLVSRDEQNVLIVSYKELKRGVENAFQDLLRAGKGVKGR